MKLKKIVFFALMAITGFAAYQSSTAAPGTSCEFCTNVDYLQLDRNGIYDSTGTRRLLLGADSSFNGTLTVSGATTLSSSLSIGGFNDLIFGTAGTVITTTTSSGNSQAIMYTAYLQASSLQIAAVEGSVLCSTNPTAGQGISVYVCNTDGALNWVGVAASAASTGTAVNFYSYGFSLTLTTGTVAAGDIMVSTTSPAGYLVTKAASTNATDVGTALAPGNAAGGLTKVRIH